MPVAFDHLLDLRHLTADQCSRINRRSPDILPCSAPLHGCHRIENRLTPGTFNESPTVYVNRSPHNGVNEGAKPDPTNYVGVHLGIVIETQISHAVFAIDSRTRGLARRRKAQTP